MTSSKYRAAGCQSYFSISCTAMRMCLSSLRVPFSRASCLTRLTSCCLVAVSIVCALLRLRLSHLVEGWCRSLCGAGGTDCGLTRPGFESSLDDPDLDKYCYFDNSF